ncbi:hypothetical protein EHI8A_100320 [Entamoeba histolytica HM-1:IMSS-B]|uniref:Uncharacterized protein n=1 Tax=Entamoeba histolytica HM-1:IMSS-B TaxID=885319 RepID=M3UXC1_ENTH1|nr:hypothetical protein EHI8A_100320 [Entamoeba histolytica HM-1:IMSS-B]
MTRVIYLGITIHEGTSTKSGTPRPYKIQQVHYATDAQPRKDLKMSSGYEPQSQQVSDEAVSRFAKLPALTEVELIWTPIPNNPQRNEVGGFKVVQQQHSA